MVLKKIRLFVIIFFLVLISLVVLFRVPFFKKTKTQLWYRSTEKGLVQEKKVASDSAEPRGQTVIEKIQEILGNTPQLSPGMDAFTEWAVLENFDAGYRLIYPAGFNINYEDDEVEITPPSGRGRVVVFIKDKTFEIKEFSEEVGEEEKMLLNAAAELVKNSFEFIDSPGYDFEEVRKRFNP